MTFRWKFLLHDVIYSIEFHYVSGISSVTVITSHWARAYSMEFGVLLFVPNFQMARFCQQTRKKEEENRISRNCLNELNFGIENEKRTNCIQWILGTTPHRLYTRIVYACIWVDKYFHVNICDSLVLCVVLCIANFILSLFCLVIMQFRVLIESAICTCSSNSTEIKTKQKFDYVDKRWRTTNKWNGINWRGWNRIVN